MDLLPFQQEAVDKMVEILRSRGGVYNACEMGLGKTAMALSAINKMPEIRSIFIVCPAIVRLVWAKEIDIWAKPNDGEPMEYKYSIISYNRAVSEVKSIVENCHIDCLILDEAHYLKSTKAKRTKIILGSIWPKAKYHICLSGTPFTQSINDCWTLFSRLSPEDFPDWWEFVNRYTKVIKTPWGMKFDGVKRPEELKALIRSKFFIRYKKSEVLKDLPEKIWTKIPLGAEYRVEMSVTESLQTQEYLDLLKQAYIKKLPLNKPPPVAVATVLKRQGLKKVAAVVEFSKNLLDQDIPLVVFGYHKEFIHQLEEHLKKYKPVVITGETSHEQRIKAVESFQSGASNCILANLLAAGTGITLTRSSTVIFGELSWGGDQIEQAAARCHRIGTKSVVNYYYFVVSDSIDERVIDTVMRKVNTFNKVLE